MHRKRSSGALPHLLDSWPQSVLPSAFTQLLPVYLSSRRRCREASGRGRRERQREQEGEQSDLHAEQRSEVSPGTLATGKRTV